MAMVTLTCLQSGKRTLVVLGMVSQSVGNRAGDSSRVPHRYPAARIVSSSSWKEKGGGSERVMREHGVAASGKPRGRW
jgi:hypothetical protein